ncbi:MAG TPA: helix-turn-helix domain-containing protein, partial [Byssovorax sp.]
MAQAQLVQATRRSGEPALARKLEMLRRHRLDGLGVTEVAHLFGVSRQTVYNVARAYDEEGLAGLVPAKSGPRGAFKCTPEIVAYVRHQRARDPDVTFRELTQLVARAFGCELHPNTIRYALAKK